MGPTWGVVATVKEDVETIKAFVAHYLSIGASEIHLYFDDPEDPAADIVAGIDRAFVTRCTEAHWSGKRPKEIEPRQKRNANQAYGKCACDWLIHLDADELLWSSGSIAAALASLDANCLAIRVPPAEMCDKRKKDELTIFRRPLPADRKGRRIARMVWGDYAQLLESGLFGHAIGKTFVRCRRDDVALSIHFPTIAGERVRAPELSGVELLHLHGGDPDKWVASLRFRLSSGAYRAAFHDVRKRAGKLDGMGRNAFLENLLEREGEAGLRRFHRQIARFGKHMRPLVRGGYLLKVRLWLPEKVEAYFPKAKESDGIRFADKPKRDGLLKITRDAKADAEMTGSRSEGYVVRYWRDVVNFGDLLSPEIVTRITGRAVVAANLVETRPCISAVGSVIDTIGQEKIAIWGSGLRRPIDRRTARNLRKQVSPDVRAVRGALTRQELLAFGWAVPEILGDPGLLVARHYPEILGLSRSEIGICLHWRHITPENVRAVQLVGKFIDPRGSPNSVISQIAACKVIISSSLHGLIVAQSLGILNCWLRFEGRPLEKDEFKFFDYETTLSGSLANITELESSITPETLWRGASTATIPALAIDLDALERAFPHDKLTTLQNGEAKEGTHTSVLI